MPCVSSYRRTKIASYIGYITQAIVNNLSPLLFVTFRRQFGISVGDIALLIIVNFCVQITVDFTTGLFADKIGYRCGVIIAHITAGIGLCSLAFLPFILPAFTGLLIATVVSGVGGGLIEVLVSPIVEALPSKGKAADMAMLHSFYCWGQMFVVAASTVFFALVGQDLWPMLPLLWAIIPFINCFLFVRAPIIRLPEPEKREDGHITVLIRQPFFRICMVLMLCAGAAELAMSQWSSMFAEVGLGVGKMTGDLLGPCGFAMFMGLGRLYYGFFGGRLRIEYYLAVSGIVGTVGYLIAVFAGHPLLSLGGCMITGLGAGLLWPGTYSLGAARIGGGSAIFAWFAMAGDIGCALGPATVGLFAGLAENGSGVIASSPLKNGLLMAVIYPALMGLTALLLCYKQAHSDNMKNVH